MEILPAYITGSFLPVFIFLARVTDVSMGTIRILYVAKGKKWLATIISFFEILIWVIVIVQIIQNLDNWLNIIAYAGGFAGGTFLGLAIEERMQIGLLMFRIITNKPSERLFQELKNAGFRVTSADAMGAFGPVKVLFTVVKRRRKKELARLVQAYAPNSFYTVEDVRHASFLEHDMTQTTDIKTRMLKWRKSV